MATLTHADRFRDRAAARSAGGSDGGNMDDILKRLSVVESLVADTRADVSAIKAVVPHLATKADLSGLKSDLSALETRIIRWLVGTMIGSVSLAFTVARFVN
ncbi:MAG: hypothetical protein WDO56_08410 [Gammaproteobacteria bacterium]